MNNLGADLRRLGDLAAARELHEDAFSRCRRLLGEDHANTLTSANFLAECLRALGDYAAARKLVEEILDRCRRVLGDTHPDTLAAAIGLADDWTRSARAPWPRS